MSTTADDSIKYGPHRIETTASPMFDVVSEYWRFYDETEDANEAHDVALRALEQRIRREALEEAAKVCDEAFTAHQFKADANSLAHCIRALIDAPAQPEDE